MPGPDQTRDVPAALLGQCGCDVPARKEEAGKGDVFRIISSVHAMRGGSMLHGGTVNVAQLTCFDNGVRYVVHSQSGIGLF